MVRSNSERGFTLIEITIVMAISAALITIAFVGQAGIRAKANFSDGLERSIGMIQQVKSEAYSTVSATGTYDTTFYGKAMLFDSLAANNKRIQIYRLTKNSSGAINATLETTKTVPNGLVVTAFQNTALPPVAVSGPVCLIFTQQENAEPLGYRFTSCNVNPPTVNVLEDETRYAAAAQVKVRVLIQDSVTSPKNAGYVEFNPSDLGAIRVVTQ